MPLDPEVMADVVLQTIELALAPLQERLAVLEAKQAGPIVAPVAEIEPEDLAASVAGLLRKELDALNVAPPVTRRRIEKDATGYTVTDEVVRG